MVSTLAVYVVNIHTYMVSTLAVYVVNIHTYMVNTLAVYVVNIHTYMVSTLAVYVVGGGGRTWETGLARKHKQENTNIHPHVKGIHIIEGNSGLAIYFYPRVPIVSVQHITVQFYCCLHQIVKAGQLRGLVWLKLQSIQAPAARPPLKISHYTAGTIVPYG